MTGKTITEKDFMSQVKDLAKIYHWKFYHTWRSIHSPAGFPDCVLVRPPRLIFAELKSDNRQSKLTIEQARWLWQLRKVAEAYVWRPCRFDKILEILK